MVVPKPRGQSWSEDACGIHCRAGQRTTEQNVEGNGRADGKSSKTRAAAALVHRRSKNDEDQKKCENRLDQNSLDSGQINCELRGSHHHYIASKKAEANQRGNEPTQKLRAPVTNGFGQRHVAAAK